MRFGLERMRRLLASLGDPQNDFPAVHVVGTNGKSSTTLLCAAALGAQGLRTASFTSPHLVGFYQRIEIDGETIARDDFAAAGVGVMSAVAEDDVTAADDDRVTQFEAVAAIAFVAFGSASVDVAVVEAGLGGRLDATNVLGNSRVQVLTGVGIDHTQYLGTTIEAIATEKLAVVRSGAALVTGPLSPVAAGVANRIADERDARWRHLSSDDRAFAGITGGFVRANASLALAAAESAHSRIRPQRLFAHDAAVAAIIELASNRGIAGRLQLTNTEPLELRDSAHNPQAAEALARALSEVAAARPVTLLVAMLEDKLVDDTLAALLEPIAGPGAVVCTQSANPRSLAAEELARRVSQVDRSQSLRVEVVEEPLAALARARELVAEGGVLCVTGSNYLLADLLAGRSAPARATL